MATFDLWMNNGAFDIFAIANKTLIVDWNIKACDDCSL
jgi:hypothetical protein